jgi:hypothetical protein
MVKKVLKILFLFFCVFVFHEVSMGERLSISGITPGKAVGNHGSIPDHFPAGSYLFAIHQQGEGGINNVHLLPEISVYSSQDESSQSVLVKAEAERRTATFIRNCRIINQFSELAKLIYPFHFFF